jgi:acid phosphatase
VPGIDCGVANILFSPFVSHQSINQNPGRLGKLQNFTAFENDVQSRKTLPQYTHLSPSMANDGHDRGLEFGAEWTRPFLGPLLPDEYFMNRTLLLLTYDESGDWWTPNRVLSILLGGAVPHELEGT